VMNETAQAILGRDLLKEFEEDDDDIDYM